MVIKRLIALAWSNFELLIWTSAVLLIIVLVPAQQHFTLCPLSNLGFDWCTGCGVGRSMHYAFLLDFTSSFQHHPAGLLAATVILQRIVKLTINLFKHNSYEHHPFTIDSGS